MLLIMVVTAVHAPQSLAQSNSLTITRPANGTVVLCRSPRRGLMDRARRRVNPSAASRRLLSVSRAGNMPGE